MTALRAGVPGGEWAIMIGTVETKTRIRWQDYGSILKSTFCTDFTQQMY